MLKRCVFLSLMIVVLLGELEAPGPASRARGGTVQATQKKQAKEAYVTLLYGGFVLGARVLAQSLKDTKTTKDLVAMCTDTVSEKTKQVLRADGWIVHPITNIHNPYSGFSSRGSYFSGAFSKLYAWNMTQYDRIVYLDSDVLVMTNIDRLFNCGTLCAAFRHSDLFNTGVMVIEPSAPIFKDMLQKVNTLSSYDAADQGFLNMYFKDLRYTSIFNWSDSSRGHRPLRLPAGLNSDVGFYYLNSRWLFPDSEVRIIHYTLGPLKPWLWWPNFLFDLDSLWSRVRNRLPQYPDYQDTYPVYLPIFWVPYPILAVLYVMVKILDCSCHRWCSDPRVSKAMTLSMNAKVSFFLPMIFLLLSYYLAFQVVPTTMLPNQAEYVFWLWSTFFLLVFLGLYCYLCHVTIKLFNKNLGIRTKKLQVLILYCVFTVSYVLLKTVTPAVKPFAVRVKVFFVLLFLHLVVSQIVGMWIIKLWTEGGMKVQDPENKENKEIREWVTSFNIYEGNVV